jgi:hypothetical protein
MSVQPGVGYTFTDSSQGTTLNIIQPWAPWATYASQDSDHPFKIVNVALRTSGGVTSVTYQVQSGTMNNLVPLIDDYASGTDVKLDRVTSGVANPPTAELVSSNFDATTKTSYITLRAGAKTASPYTYPDDDDTTNQYPVIIGGNVAPTTPDDNTWGFLVIGTITVDNITTPTTFTVSQNVTGSLWADRIKLAGITARYYYARI